MTLIEILVVIAIIAILAAMAAWAVVPMITNREARNTEATIRVLNKALQEHWRAVIDQARTEKPSEAVKQMAIPDPSGERAQVLWIKFRLREAFPQMFKDDIGNHTLAGIPPAMVNVPFVYTFDAQGNQYIPTNQRYIAQYQNAIKGYWAAVVAGNSTTSPLTESGACLRIALSIKRGNAAVLNEDNLKYAIADTDNDGIMEFIDSFSPPLSPMPSPSLEKTPLAFFRFAWNYQNTAAGVAAVNFQNLSPAAGKGARDARFADPVDPNGTLINPNWMFIGGVPNPQRLLFEAQFHPVTYPYPAANQPYTACYAAPVIVSAGPAMKNLRGFDLNLDATGHFLPEMSLVAPAQRDDNIYSFQLGGT